jgi:hypothetical protein
MIGTALRFAGQRLLPIVAPAGGRAFAKEAAINAGLTIAAEQGLPLITGNEAPPIEKTLLRSALIGGLSGPVERGIIGGAKQLSPRLAGMQGRLQERLSGVPYMPEPVARGLSGGAAATGKFALGVAGMAAVTEPITKAVTNVVFPEGYGGGRNTQTGMQADMTGAQLTNAPETVVNTSPEAANYQRQLELTYARNYKFPSYIYHVSQSGAPNPFEIANQMLSTPTTRYF